MAITKVTRQLLSTGINDNSNATAITIDSSENSTFAGNVILSGTGQLQFDHSIIADDIFDTDALGLACHPTESIRFGSHSSGSYTQRMKMMGDGRFSITAEKADGYALSVTNDGNAGDVYGVKIQCGTDNASGTNTAVVFCDGDGTTQGTITFSSGTVSYNAFTAGHQAILPNSDNDAGYAYGTLVETTAITSPSEQSRDITYTVRKTSTANSKAVLGVYSNSLNGTVMTYNEDGTTNEKHTNRHEIYVLGDGHILCNNSGGNIAVGDGIASSSTEGIGCKATANPSMIIGIAQEAVTFTGSETKLVPVQYGLQQFTPWT